VTRLAADPSLLFVQPIYPIGLDDRCSLAAPLDGMHVLSRISFKFIPVQPPPNPGYSCTKLFPIGMVGPRLSTRD
jgi:hypothetical protein